MEEKKKKLHHSTKDKLAKKQKFKKDKKKIKVEKFNEKTVEKTK